MRTYTSFKTLVTNDKIIGYSEGNEFEGLALNSIIFKDSDKPAIRVLANKETEYPESDLDIDLQKQFPLASGLVVFGTNKWDRPRISLEEMEKLTYEDAINIFKKIGVKK